MESFDPLDNWADTNGMVTYLHLSVEHERASLARELHDELGGLMVSAVMDVAFAEQNLQLDERLRQRLTRVRNVMTEAIDIKRKMIETLRPSILDNFGLFAALKWEVRHGREITRIPCRESYPDVEPDFTKEGAIRLFRIVQESLRLALQQPAASLTALSLEIAAATVHIAVSHDGRRDTTRAVAPDELFAICSIAHRAHALGGRMSVTIRPGGGAYEVWLPLTRVASA